MKYLLLSLLSIPAFAAATEIAGTFNSDHEFAMMSYNTKAECEADQGKWEGNERDGTYCLFQGTDSAVVRKKGDTYNVTISVITTNAHTCDFEADAKLNDAGQLVASAPSEEWNEEKGAIEPATCEVTLNYTEANSVDVTNNGKCTSFCGMRARLDFSGAKRQ